MKKKSLLLTWTRWTAAGIANLTMAISPLAMGKAQEARASALADFQKAYKEVGLGSGATVGEVWEKMRGHVSGDVQAMMDPIFRGQKVKFPKVDVVPFKDKDGSEKLRILVQGFEPNKAPMTITFWDKDDKYIQFNDKIAKRSDADSLVQLSKALGVGDIEKLSQAFAQARGQMKGAGAANARQVASVQSSGKPAVAAKVAPKANVFKSAAEIAKMDINKQLTYMVGMRRLYDAMEAVQRLAVKDPSYAKTKIIIPSSVPEEPQFTYIDWFLNVTQAMAKGQTKKKKADPANMDTTCVNGGWVGKFDANKVRCAPGAEDAKKYQELLSKCGSGKGNDHARPCNPSLFGYKSGSEPICIAKPDAGSDNSWSQFSSQCAIDSKTPSFGRCASKGSIYPTTLEANMNEDNSCIQSAKTIIKSWMGANNSCTANDVKNLVLKTNNTGKIQAILPIDSKCKINQLPEYTAISTTYKKLAEFCYKVEQKASAVDGSKAPGKNKLEKLAEKCKISPDIFSRLGTLGKNPCNQIEACDALQGRFFEIEQEDAQEPKTCIKPNQHLNSEKNECVCKDDSTIKPGTSGENLECIKCESGKCPPPCSDGGTDCRPPGGKKTNVCMIKSTGRDWLGRENHIESDTSYRFADSDETDTNGNCKNNAHAEYSCLFPMNSNNVFTTGTMVNATIEGGTTTFGNEIPANNTQYSLPGCLLGFGLIAMLVTCLRQRITTHKGFCGKAKPENNDIVTDTGVEGGTGTTNPNLPAPAVVGGQQ